MGRKVEVLPPEVEKADKKEDFRQPEVL